MTDATLTGHSLIAGTTLPGTAGTVSGFDPRDDSALAPEYSLLAEDQVEAATRAAHEAFPAYRALDPQRRGAFLDRIADSIEAVREDLVARAMAETGLTEARLNGETTRTTNQLRLFADVVRRGDHHGVRVDPAQPERTPLPRPDIRQRQVPLGPVVVFGASNFPLAFSTAGGDTASALAAGCPVIVKAHNAHPGTAEIVGRAIAQAAEECEIHPGVFSLVYGPGASIGQALAADPRVKAVGFTGSRRAGTSLMATAAARPVPIPVYAEMSSINPVFVLPGALKGDGAAQALAEGFVGSLTGSSGQLCTAPGLVFVPSGDAGDRFAAAITEQLDDVAGQTMLTRGIAEAWQTGADALSDQEGVDELARGTDGPTCNAPAPLVLSTDTEAFKDNGELQAEVFGSASLVVRYTGVEDLVDSIRALEGQLTATLHLADSDLAAAQRLLPELEDTVGRILANGWPTGVEVGHAMVHGGPFPATSDSRTTSVGTLAIERFLRPVAYQDLPEGLLPAPVAVDNPWNLNRRIDGETTLSGKDAE
ncbi:aldehyde dehydrogenase (NADP(+)) [Micrococcus sp. HG099]|uniref:aldehyde dehydrogenase (NADP(+)) n=1 Tax=Micrococcus sp. HG099 TaxID=2969755 RepID=UPI00215B1657|nr:aldehyde dehydrogenase (NADP(+)) [Micrococcus sp. HG099]MCR8674558.1 aldehyde dehydrogenase (NADP(+)) [Micrococcus sp. HG099]